MSCYRYEHNLSQLTTQSEKYYLDTLKLFNDLYSNYKKDKIQKILKKRLSNINYDLGYYYKINSLNSKASKYLVTSILYNPKNIKAYKTLISLCLPHKNKKFI